MKAAEFAWLGGVRDAAHFRQQRSTPSQMRPFF
jgi:hypothetical protein